MNPSHRLSSKALTSCTFVLVLGFAALASRTPLLAQDKADMQARVAELKESMAKNKAALAQYTWKETVKISLKGEEKKTEHFQVHDGPDGKPVKTSLDPAPAAQEEAGGGGRGGRLKQHVVEKKKEEYKEYADQMKELASHYVPPNKEAIQEAMSKGNISLDPGGDPGQVKLVIHNYYKQGDSMTLRFDKNQKQLAAISIASYMDNPQDAMNLNVAFGKLPDGTNHVSNVTIEGVSKQLTVNTANSDYQKM
jgi:hypothetical protein